jgi:hypothetical protein
MSMEKLCTLNGSDYLQILCTVAVSFLTHIVKHINGLHATLLPKDMLIKLKHSNEEGYSVM